MKNYIISGLTALAVSLAVFFLAPGIFGTGETIKIEHVDGMPVQGAVLTVNGDHEIVPLDFTKVSQDVMEAVVHIKSTQTAQMSQSLRQYRQLPDPFKDFFGDQGEGFFFGPQGSPQGQNSPSRVGTGSGVIINSGGYIVTNNHVVADASDIEVALHDNRTFKATVIGTDPATDLALLQIQAKDLPTLPLVNSDDVRIGEWVLAVGNPFNLNSTVTAGIVSAKSRSINILQDQYAVESFIQTDAAINPGNSGGALVNLQGGLIGINTAIASPTGAYAGYGFAVPANIVSKVVEDLLKYGTVQRGFLGIRIRGVEGNLAKEKELSVNTGVYVEEVGEESAAAAAGVKAGDVIVAVNALKVQTPAELQELIARNRPGDDVKLSLIRGKKDLDLTVQLKGQEGETKIVAAERNELFNELGASFENISKEQAAALNITGGVKVSKLYAGKISRQTSMREGFIITKVDGQLIRNVEELIKALENKNGGVLVEGVYEGSPEVFYYGFGMS
jgi:Do/DeqQ family serine protease